MAILVVGVVRLRAVAVVPAAITLERLAPAGSRVGRRTARTRARCVQARL